MDFPCAKKLAFSVLIFDFAYTKNEYDYISTFPNPGPHLILAMFAHNSAVSYKLRFIYNMLPWVYTYEKHH